MSVIMEGRLLEETGRLYRVVGFGFALYEVAATLPDGNLRLTHKGLAKTRADAMYWVAGHDLGEDGHPIVYVYPQEEE